MGKFDSAKNRHEGTTAQLINQMQNKEQEVKKEEPLKLDDYKLEVETKSARVNALMTPSLKRNAEYVAKEYCNMSLNAFINEAVYEKIAKEARKRHEQEGLI